MMMRRNAASVALKAAAVATAVRAVTFVMLQSYLRVPRESNEVATAQPAQLRLAI